MPPRGGSRRRATSPRRRLAATQRQPSGNPAATGRQPGNGTAARRRRDCGGVRALALGVGTVQDYLPAMASAPHRPPEQGFEASFDVVVIGAGHAGTEAAVAAARAGTSVGLITSALETIGQMSCNPAIGGIAKGTVVREVDALGGIMARATDLATLQFRMLNQSKGPAVWAPRAQCDRGLYRRAIRSLIEHHHAIHTIQGTVASLIIDAEGRRIRGVETLEGRRFAASAVVLTAGTFLRGRIHIGTGTAMAGGRAGEGAAVDIAEQLERVGLAPLRFKTGTPPRIDGRTVEYSRLQRQDSEIAGFDYSWSHFWPTPRAEAGRTRHPMQLPCWITHLGAEGRRIVADHIGESAMYGGAISARGPRYCPSVEDKIVRFPDAERHQIFLEPEGHDTTELYVNGLSTSLPAPVQLALLRSVPGLEAVRMTRAGYAIEYDYFPPTELHATLESRRLCGLFLAGQVNGTTGYEEAAGQGLIAGINAARGARGERPLTLGRDSSYIGVLIDDLVTRGVDEPYRLFTSRSEFRLTVRQDNALRRLAPVALELGLYRDEEAALAGQRLEAEDRTHRVAAETSLRPEDANPVLEQAGSATIQQPTRVADLARRQGVDLLTLLTAARVETGVSRDTAMSVELEIKYAGYFERERVLAEKLRRMAQFPLPPDLPYEALRSLSIESRQKLAARRPATLAQAASIPGVNPSDLQNLVIEVERLRRTAGETAGAP
ncbi:MAG TPA: tRNA uridine-5-carboxymethylaminomethyl(34) synthesis enzyme MnmG [Gemmatimonadaceae bacterium]|nr:tRNA uridine-5-carboxymethylaminomethyl(34) synthesis enzyme MnmG [Gemmatimonadaceae bacterium]